LLNWSPRTRGWSRGRAGCGSSIQVVPALAGFSSRDVWLLTSCS
jgi:hypothetical protein